MRSMPMASRTMHLELKDITSVKLVCSACAKKGRKFFIEMPIGAIFADPNAPFKCNDPLCDTVFLSGMKEEPIHTFLKAIKAVSANGDKYAIELGIEIKD